MGSVIPYLKRKGRFASHCWGAFFLFLSVLLGIRYLGSGVSFDVLGFDDSNGYYGSHFSGGLV